MVLLTEVGSLGGVGVGVAGWKMNSLGVTWIDGGFREPLNVCLIGS